MTFGYLKKIGAAAARLAIVYIAGVALLYVPIRLWLTPHSAGLRELPTLSLQLGIYAAIVFVVLATARRFGFLLFWGLLLVVWSSNLTGISSSVRQEALPGLFILWTVLALPLYVITAWGTSAASSDGRKRFTSFELGALLWLVLIIGAFLHIFIHEPLDRIAPITAFIWVPAPFIVAALAVVRIWVATGRETTRGGLTSA